MIDHPDLSIHHIQTIVQALYQLAQADGVHSTERVMLRDFYDQCQADGNALTSFDELLAQPFDLADNAEDFHSDDLKIALLNSCLLLAYADGQYTTGEREKIRSYAATLNFSADDLAQLEETVADHLMQQISRISNMEALQEVAQEMKPK